MNKLLILRIQEVFEKKLSVKNGWGKNEVMAQYKNAVNEVILEMLDDVKND